MSKKKSHSLLPPQYQVPATLAMAVVFVIVVYFRLGPGARKSSPTPPPAPAPVAAGQPLPAVVSLGGDAIAKLVTDLNDAMLQLKKVAAAAPAPQPVAPLAGNPFFPAAFELEHVEVEEGQSDTEVSEGPAVELPQLLQPIEELIAAPEPLPKLTGVVVQGSNRIAILDGDYYRVGERKGEMTVADIQERRVLLKQGDQQHWVSVEARRTKAQPRVEIQEPASATEGEVQ